MIMLLGICSTKHGKLLLTKSSSCLMYTDPCTIALSFMRYSVHCPSAPYENSSFVDIDDAWGLCLDLSEEFGYAEVRQGEHMLGSYTNGQ